MTTLTYPEPGHHRRDMAVGASTLVAGLLLFAAVLFGLTAGVGAIWTAVTSGTGGSGPAAPGGVRAAAAAPAASTLHQIKLVVNPPPLGGVKGPDGQPHDAFVPATFTMTAGDTYQVTVLNYDDMPHTWTAPGLGVNAMIRAGSDTSPSTTTFTIKPTTAGTFEWHCATPCDSWAMAHDGYMRGTVTVAA